MFTRAVISDEISQDLELAAGMARDFGLDQLEIRTAWDVRIDNMNTQELDRVKRIASEHGLGIVCLASPFFKAELGSDAEYQEHIALLRRAIAAAHTLGAGIIRTFTFWKKGEIGPVFDRIVEAYAEPARIAAGEGVVLGIENEPACFAGTAKETAEVLEAIGSPAVKSVWDPGNAYWTGNERQTSLLRPSSPRSCSCSCRRHRRHYRRSARVCGARGARRPRPRPRRRLPRPPWRRPGQ